MGTDGMIVRDDRRKEIVVAFRGTSELADAITGELTDQMQTDCRSEQLFCRYYAPPCSSSFYRTHWCG